MTDVTAPGEHAWRRKARIRFLGVPVDVLTKAQTLELAAAAITERRPLRHVALNVAKFVKLRRDLDLARDVAESDIIGIDGMGIAWALTIFGVPEVSRVAGIDLMLDLMAWCAQHGRRPFVLGARAEVLVRAAAAARQKYPGLDFAGLRDGYFAPEQEAQVVREIRESGADCLFVAMPTPRKERFLRAYAANLGIPFVMGIGGSVDVLAGEVRRAPEWMQRCGLEWLYRLLQEPKKMFWRYAKTNTAFLFLLIKAGFLRLMRRPVIVKEN
jgi:N-acetylglucosaminyldiphosphoundecaprenol N-acetyl-beta-D-mannosaminyltransferase